MDPHLRRKRRLRQRRPRYCPTASDEHAEPGNGRAEAAERRGLDRHEPARGAERLDRAARPGADRGARPGRRGSRGPRDRAHRRRPRVLLGRRPQGRRRARRRRPAGRADAAARGLQPADPAGAHDPQAGDRRGQRPRGRDRLLAGAGRGPDRGRPLGLFPAGVREHRARPRRRRLAEPGGSGRARARVRDRLPGRADPRRAGAGLESDQRGRRRRPARTRRVGELAAKLAAGPPGSYAAIKRTINARAYDGFEELLDLEAVLQQERAELPGLRRGRAGVHAEAPGQVHRRAEPAPRPSRAA